MEKFFLPPDDLPPESKTLNDQLLRRELEEFTTKRFFLACDRITQVLLSHCHWRISIKLLPLTLIIHCPDMETYWYILNDVPQLGNRLERFTNKAKIRVYPPTGQGAPFEVKVDEIPLYGDWL